MEGMESTGAILHRYIAGHGQVLIEHEFDFRVLLAVPADQTGASMDFPFAAAREVQFTSTQQRVVLASFTSSSARMPR